jgi:hypothetical protein
MNSRTFSALLHIPRSWSLCHERRRQRVTHPAWPHPRHTSAKAEELYQTGADLVISRDYISRGLRSRVEEFASIELGPKPEHEIRNALEKEIAAERWTRLDVEIRMAADETGAIDLRPENPGAADPEIRRLMIGRLQHLEKMGLAAPAGPGEWMVGLEAERNLRDLGVRGDVIKTMHRVFTDRGEARGVAIPVHWIVILYRYHAADCLWLAGVTCCWAILRAERVGHAWPRRWRRDRRAKGMCSARVVPSRDIPRAGACRNNAGFVVIRTGKFRHPRATVGSRTGRL